MKSKVGINSESTNFLYAHKTDLAEINRFNYRILLRDYFHLTTKKITLMSMMLALNFLLTIFSRYVLGLVPIAGFFVIEISFVSVLMFSLMNNFFYTIIFLEVTVWFRLALGSEPIGLLAMNLVDGFFIIVFCLAVFVFKRIIVKRQLTNWVKKLFVYEVIIIFFITLLTGAMAVLVNNFFLLKIYFPEWDQKQIVHLLPIIFGLNVAKYFINAILYFIAFKPLIMLVKHYRA